jgi:hypothetical protein
LSGLTKVIDKEEHFSYLFGLAVAPERRPFYASFIRYQSRLAEAVPTRPAAGSGGSPISKPNI